MNNLKKFETEADYNSASLNYPAVSWVVSGDTVHFDKTAPTPPLADNVAMITWTSESGGDGTGKDIVLYNDGSSDVSTYMDSITVNDVAVTPIVAVLTAASTPNTDYLVKYTLKDNEGLYSMGDIFAGDLGGGWGSTPLPLDFLIPSQITSVDNIPSNIHSLVIMATTPPTTSLGTSAFENLEGIYVPTDSLSAYQSTWGSTWGERIKPISQYSGNLPV